MKQFLFALAAIFILVGCTSPTALDTDSLDETVPEAGQGNPAEAAAQPLDPTLFPDGIAPQPTQEEEQEKDETGNDEGSLEGENTGEAMDDTKENEDETNQERKIITVDAERRKFTPSTITVKQGEKVKLVINNIDTTHNATFETMNVTTDTNDAIILDTSTSGLYPFHCANYCGEGHKDMKGVVIVE